MRLDSKALRECAPGGSESNVDGAVFANFFCLRRSKESSVGDRQGNLDSGRRIWTSAGLEESDTEVKVTGDCSSAGGTDERFAAGAFERRVRLMLFIRGTFSYLRYQDLSLTEAREYRDFAPRKS